MNASRVEPEEFFARCAELKPFDFLADLDRSTALVCDGAFVEYLNTRQRRDGQSLTAPVVQWVDEESVLHHDVSAFDNFIVCSLDREAAIIDALRSIVPERVTLGFVSDVATCLAAGSSVWQMPNEVSLEEEVASLDHALVVVCTPRSGSTYFCDLLKTSGLCGEIKEDLRPHLLYLVKNRERLNFDFSKWLALLLRSRRHEETFATKIIAHFLFELIAHLEQDQLAMLTRLFRDTDSQLIYLHREDKVQQAVSSFFASETRVWHISTPQRDREARKRADGVTYDFVKLKRGYDRILEQEGLLADLLSHAGTDVVRVTYEDLKQSPNDTIMRIALKLGQSHLAAVGQMVSKQRLTSNAKTKEIEIRFRAELASAEE